MPVTAASPPQTRMPMKRLFSDWNKEELEETFELTRLFDENSFEAWFMQSKGVEIKPFEEEMLKQLQSVLVKNADAWNELELSEYFIGPMLALVNFNTDFFKIFTDRTIQATIGEYELMGEPDAVIATGHYSPKVPYFCFHEYKRSFEPKKDPAGQALAAMLTARELNPRQHPIYGMYVVAEKWHFMILNGREYCISKGFLADDEEIFDIFKILKALKVILIEIAKQDA